MKIIYIKLNNNNKVVRFDTNKMSDSIPILVEDDMLNNGKMMSCYYIDGALQFDKQLYDEKINCRTDALELAKKQEEDEQKLKSIEMRYRLSMLNDEEAYSVMSLFPEWRQGENYAQSDRVAYDSTLYDVTEEIINTTQTPDKDSRYKAVVKR